MFQNWFSPFLSTKFHCWSNYSVANAIKCNQIAWEIFRVHCKPWAWLICIKIYKKSSGHWRIYFSYSWAYNQVLIEWELLHFAALLIVATKSRLCYLKLTANNDLTNFWQISTESHPNVRELICTIREHIVHLLVEWEFLQITAMQIRAIKLRGC